MTVESETDAKAWLKWGGLLGGPLLAVIFYFSLPTHYFDAAHQAVVFTEAGRLTLAVMVWMAVWWLTEAINISATALLPLVLLPLSGAATTEAASAPYAHPLIFLVMGGFLIALSMQKWGLDKRVALVTLRYVGTNPRNMVGGFMFVTAGLSAFVSNTATTAMMLPIALSMIELVRGAAVRQESTSPSPDDTTELLAVNMRERPAAAESFGGEDKSESQSEQTSTSVGLLQNPIDNESGTPGARPPQTGDNFAACTLLGLAYASSVGGISTIIGTAPNAFLVAFINETIATPHRMEVSFTQWLALALPLTLVFLPTIWIVLTYFIYPIRLKNIPGGKELIQRGLANLGPANFGEKATLVVFLLTASLWVFRPAIATVQVGGATPFSGLSDPVIAMLGAMLLFVIPAGAAGKEAGTSFVMDWETAMKVPWGILLLFGGGLSLSEAVQTNGVAEFIGSQARYFAGLPPLVHVLAVTTTVIFLTELTSNIATTAALLPVLAALAPGLGIHPYLLIFPATIAASCAFMMPVATPPNAIVFGSGEVTIAQMIRAGFWLNLIGIVLVTALAFTVLPHALGLPPV